jgi:formylglycine-generating enzyme required for sulfatase activity
LGGVQAQGHLLVQDQVEARSVETKTRVFISYSRKDMAFTDRLEAALKARGFEVLIDRQEIYAFEDWWKRIEALIDRADTVIFVLSPEAVKSQVALKEVAYAVSLNKRFAPIVCGRVEDTAVPEALRRLHFIFYDDPERFDASTDRLTEALQTDIVWIRRHTEFGDTARRWVEAGRPSGMLLRPPVLDQAEAWLAFRPSEAPAPTAETETFIARSRTAMLGAQRLQRFVVVSIFTLLIGIILGLIGWINQDLIKQQWRWYTVTRPFMLAQVRPYILNTAKEQTLKPKDSFRECRAEQGNDLCPEMVVLPAGSFLMGEVQTQNSSANPSGQMLSSTAPPHQVTITKPFAVSRFELTYNEWDTCVAYGDCAEGIPDSFGRGQRPVSNVTWDDAQHYSAWLSKMTGKPYRLLTEAEYEYATRAGTQTAYPWGDDIGKGNANCYGCGTQWDGKQTAPVGSFPPNMFGLYDMVGNQWEWVEDCFHPTYDGAPTDGSAWTTACLIQSRHVIRAGSFLTAPQYLRSAARFGGTTILRNFGPGFRIARTLTAP